MFSTTYPQENNTQRLDRLDQRVFGDVQSGTDSTRSARLQGVLKNLLTPTKAVTTPQSNGGQSESGLPNSGSPYNNGYADSPTNTIPDATDYPTVTALERQVFGRDFIREDVPLRLNRLEKKVFGQANPNRPMADRVDSLLSRYPNVMANASTAPDVVNVAPAKVNPILQSLPDDSSQFSSSQRDIYSKLDAL